MLHALHYDNSYFVLVLIYESKTRNYIKSSMCKQSLSGENENIKQEINI